MLDIRNIAHLKLSDNITDQSLEDLIEWLDIAYSKDNSVEGLPSQIITRSLIAMGYYLLENVSFSDKQRQNISNTLEAAIEYAIYPNERNFDIYFSSATDSYPFGAGDGCHALPQIDKHEKNSCAVGTGCRSGSGSLKNYKIDDKIIFKVISEDLSPWLKGDSDPILDNLPET